MTWWPGWDSIEGAKGWADFYFWFGIGCLVLLAVSEVISHRYGLRKDELVAAAEVTTSKQRKADQDAADARHAAEIGGLKGQLSEAEKKVENLRSQQIARRLTPDQKTALIGALSPFASQKVFIWCSTAAWDCTDFAVDFMDVFKSAGWQPTDQIRYGIMVGGDAVGIEVLVNPQIANPATGQVSMPSVVTLVNTLVALNLILEPALGREPSIGADTIYFRIGRIPPK
jgi:hypothetical protein